MGTVNVLDACAQTDERARRRSTSRPTRCYENREWEWGYREDEPKGGHDPYSNSKACAELVTAAYRESFFGPDSRVAVATARAGNVIGGGDWGEDRLIPDIMRAALAGEELADPQPGRDPARGSTCSTRSAATSAGRALWESDELADGWNFGPDERDARPVRWIVERLTRAVGRADPLARTTAARTRTRRCTCGSTPRRRASGSAGRRAGTSTRRSTSIVAWYKALQPAATCASTRCADRGVRGGARARMTPVAAAR